MKKAAIAKALLFFLLVISCTHKPDIKTLPLRKLRQRLFNSPYLNRNLNAWDTPFRSVHLKMSIMR
jgi:hypothetical protein